MKIRDQWLPNNCKNLPNVFLQIIEKTLILIFVHFSNMPEEFAMAIQRFAKNGTSKQF